MSRSRGAGSAELVRGASYLLTAFTGLSYFVSRLT